MIITEPKWKSLIVETTGPIFTPEQCQLIINAGRAEPPQTAQVGGGGGGVVDTKTRISHISWIPFNKLPEMYKTLEEIMKKTNGNHFGFEGVQITEQAQYTEYPAAAFLNLLFDSFTRCHDKIQTCRNAG